jgi:diguanylate cyclase (GGDEF)-like protein
MGATMPVLERFRVTAEVIQAITSSLVLDEVLASVAERTAEVLDLWECDIYAYRPADDVVVAEALWTRVSQPDDQDWLGSTPRREQQPLLYESLNRRAIIAAYIDDPELPAAERKAMQGWGEKSCLYVPLLFHDEIIGCVELVEKRAVRRFTAAERELASTLGALAAVAIANARLYGHVEQLAKSDGLTGLANLRVVHERLAADVVRARRYGLPLSLLMLDIDDFKAFNDAGGHPAGDDLLRRVADLLRAQTRRQIDLVARYGGDEFAIILPSTGVAQARMVAARLQVTVAEPLPARVASGADNAVAGAGQAVQQGAGGDGQAASGADSQLASPAGPGAGAWLIAERIRTSIADDNFGSKRRPPVVTVSIGVAGLDESTLTTADLVQAADRALYGAKEGGKNRVVVASAGTVTTGQLVPSTDAFAEGHGLT